MYLGKNNGNLSETKNVFSSQPFLKMRKALLDIRKSFLKMSNFYLVEILKYIPDISGTTITSTVKLINNRNSESPTDNNELLKELATYFKQQLNVRHEEVST